MGNDALKNVRKLSNHSTQVNSESVLICPNQSHLYSISVYHSLFRILKMLFKRADYFIKISVTSNFLNTFKNQTISIFLNLLLNFKPLRFKKFLSNKQRVIVFTFQGGQFINT